MKTLVLALLLSFSISSFAQLPGSKTKPFIKPDPTKTEFGAPLNLKQKTHSVDEAIVLFKNKKTEPILLEAKIDKVCQKKGCWMTIKGKEREMRVTFKDYAFFVPVSLEGKTIYAEGFVKEEKLSLEETKHFAADEGRDPSKVTEPAIDYQFEAIGVVVKK